MTGPSWGWEVVGETCGAEELACEVVEAKVEERSSTWMLPFANKIVLGS